MSRPPPLIPLRRETRKRGREREERRQHRRVSREEDKQEARTPSPRTHTKRVLATPPPHFLFFSCRFLGKAKGRPPLEKKTFSPSEVDAEAVEGKVLVEGVHHGACVRDGGVVVYVACHRQLSESSEAEG